MKITDSCIQMDSQHSLIKQQSSKETFEFWTQEQNQITNDNILNDSILLDISDKGKALQQNAAVFKPDKTSSNGSFYLSEKDKEKIRLIEGLLSLLTGKKFKLKIFDSEKLSDKKRKELESLKHFHEQNQVSVQQGQGWGLKYDRYESCFEAEKMSFNSSGNIKTEDGRVINFNLNLNISREFMSSQQISIRAGDALIDPLVINFNNSSASLGDRNYSFDIDSDGMKDNIAFTGMGSGFLVLDQNNNNIVDNGSELFGPQTGNGFNELADYDYDKNNWIDKNDKIFDKLRIWTLDEKGNKALIALGQVGVGAIYLGNVNSEYSLNTSLNDSLGQIRSTGIFLKENGQVGTIQHVDLAI